MTPTLFNICLDRSHTGPAAPPKQHQQTEAYGQVVGTSGQANARYTAADGIWKLAASSLCQRCRRGVSCTMRGWPTSSLLACGSQLFLVSDNGLQELPCLRVYR